MGYFMFFICIVAAITGCCQVATGKRPSMYTPGGSEELYLLTDEELRIECQANGSKIRFSFPESTVLEIRSMHEIKQSENGTYTFIRPRTTYRDTGWYACAEEGTEIDNDFRNVNHTDEDVSWIYVYVDLSLRAVQPELYDIGVVGFVKTLIVVPGNIVIIPCQYPRFNLLIVHLWQDDRPVNLEEDAVRHDPRIGFIMNRVDFVEGRALLQCKASAQPYEVAPDHYILRSSGPKPTMFTAHDKDLTLQEGDELRIECSNITKLSFLFPKLASNSSAHKIMRNENKTSTFLRSSVISDDTGWYGCAALDIGDDYIADHLINYTRKEIAWVYVYVNSSVPMISGLVDTGMTTYNPKLIIPCKPTSPELHHIYLNRRDRSASENWILVENATFDPKVGFVLLGKVPDAEYQCTMDEPIRFVSKNYILDAFARRSGHWLGPPIGDADDPSVTQDLMIKMTGDDLRMYCKRVVYAESPSNFEWGLPNRVLKERARYAKPRVNSHVMGRYFFRTREEMMTIMNVTESDSGEYLCSDGDLYRRNSAFTSSRDVEIFDENGARYIRLSKKGGAIQVAGLKGETVKWLVDLTDYPSAINITWIDPQGDVITASDEFYPGQRRVRTAWARGAPQLLFEIGHLTVADRGDHELRTNTEDRTVVVNVTVNVQERPTISLKEITDKNSTIGICEAVGSLEFQVTVSFLKCPKFPSMENHTLLKFDDDSTICHQYKDPISSGRKIIKKITMNQSGFMMCQACDRFGCSEAQAKHLHSDLEIPYFTSTNLNDSDVVLDVETHNNEPLILQCFVSGTPYPSVTWLRNNIPIKENHQYVLAYDNSELRIHYFLGKEGGQYKCIAENVNGRIERHINVKIRDVSSSTVITVIVLLLVVIVICCGVIYRLLVKVSREKKFNSAFRRGAPDRFDPELSVVDQAHLLPYHPKWEFPRELLKLDKILGSGAFGIVKKAEAKSICRGEAVTTVAVKLVRSTASLNFITALERELKILAYLGRHPNVVNLLGACTRNVIYGELFVIVEYCRFGNLRDYLLAERADFVDEIHGASGTADPPSLGLEYVADTDGSRLNLPVDGGNGVSATLDCGSSEDDTGSDGSSDHCTEDGDGCDAPRWASKYRADYTELDSEPTYTRDLVYWSWQVSRAMIFLGTRKIVHGDLAARNILLSDRGIVKICDFGLAKALHEEAEYRDKGANPLPVRWMAIESIKDHVFSYQSDIWSFGVVMWELFTLAETPYPGIRHRELLQKLMDGHRLEHPKYATTSIYDIMRQCWEADPGDRPSFAVMAHNLDDILEDGFRMEYLAMHAQYMEMTPFT